MLSSATMRLIRHSVTVTAIGERQRSPYKYNYRHYELVCTREPRDTLIALMKLASIGKARRLRAAVTFKPFNINEIPSASHQSSKREPRKIAPTLPSFRDADLRICDTIPFGI